MNKCERQPIPFSATSSPTGEIIHFGQGVQSRISVRKQNTPEACGQTCLEMLGYSLDGVELTDPENGVSTADLFWTFGLEEVPDVNSVDFTDVTPHMVVGTKIKTGWDHWYLRVGDTVINPETGEVEKADAYQQREIGEVKAVVPVPFAKQ